MSKNRCDKCNEIVFELNDLKYITCIKCNKKDMVNVINTIDICKDCSESNNICSVCGEPISKQDIESKSDKIKTDVVLDVLKYLDANGFLKGSDKLWLSNLINKSDTYRLWIDSGDMHVSYVWDEEDFEYSFIVTVGDLGFAVLKYMKLGFDII